MELFSGLNVVLLKFILVCVNVIDRLMGNSLALQCLFFFFFHIEVGKQDVGSCVKKIKTFSVCKEAVNL